MSSPASPGYRYREECPVTIRVPAEELVAQLPGELRDGGETAGRMIDLPGEELLRGNTPRMTLGSLHCLLPDLIRIPEGRVPEEQITLPPGWVALHFRLVTVREEIAPASLSEVMEVAAVDSEESTAPVHPDRGAPTPTVIEVRTESVEEVVIAPPKSSEKEDSAAPRAGFFASLPIFHRNAKTAPAPHGTPDPVSVVSPEKVAEKGSVLVPPPPPTLERLWKLDPSEEISDMHALQALFMTDEKLTLEKVISKAGELPGLDACVLAHGDQVLCASKAPVGTDLQTLSGQAMTMLSQIRDSSEKMGLGAVPAVTLHADRGVVSFLHRGELCLLVLHADRGFVPGVRERLQEMLGHLDSARPALPPLPKS